MEVVSPKIENHRRLGLPKGWFRKTAAAPSRPDIQELLTETPEEQMLASAQLDHQSIDLLYRTRFLTLPNGSKVVLKSAAGGSHKLERAAYLASRIIGLDIVPPTVLRLYQGKPATLQLAVNGLTGSQYADKLLKRGGEFATHPPEHAKLMAGMAIFDIAIWNIDRNARNFINGEEKVWAIDHETSFFCTWTEQPRTHGIILGIPIPEATSAPYVELANDPKRQSALEKRVGPLIGREYMTAFAGRLATIAAMLTEQGQISPINFDGTPINT